MLYDLYFIFQILHSFQLVLNNSLLLTNWLESLLISVKLKEELANSLVYLHENNNTLIEFLTSLVVREVSDLGKCYIYLTYISPLTKCIHIVMVNYNIKRLEERLS